MIKELHGWSTITVPSASRPGKQSTLLMGFKTPYDATMVRTSRIVSIIDDTITTFSGSEYKLMGKGFGPYQSAKEIKFE